MNTTPNTVVNSIPSARVPNAKGCQGPKMGIVTINGRMCLVEQAGSKVRVSVSKIATFLGIPANSCLRIT